MILLQRACPSPRQQVRSLPRFLDRVESLSVPWLSRPASSNSRWRQRQGKDAYAREARVQGLKSRAAFKLLEMDEKYKIFKRGQTVVDLGYAPGSWSQVALGRTKPHGRIIGVDLLPAQPPSGVTAFQGDFSSPMVQKLVKDLIVERHKVQPPPPKSEVDDLHDEPGSLVSEQLSYIDMERHASQEYSNQVSTQLAPLRLVDVVLSDMSAPWEQTSGFNTNTMSNPYHRLMNTSGMPFRDHAGSMDLCDAALQFASDTLRPGGHFICKFYQGTEDKHLEKKLRQLFGKVHREKPESSRSESKEAYFIGLRRKAGATVDGNKG